MPKICNGCKSPIPEGRGCPRCTPAPEARSAIREAARAGGPVDGGAEIDLGSPVTTVDENLSGPPSGASFLSWEAILEARLQAKARGEADTTVEEEEPEIDLGAPVMNNPEASGPASGASLVSWDALLRARQASIGAKGQTVTSEPAPAPPPPPVVEKPVVVAETTSQAAPPERGLLWWSSVAAVGVGVAIVLFLVFRLLG